MHNDNVKGNITITVLISAMYHAYFDADIIQTIRCAIYRP